MNPDRLQRLVPVVTAGFAVLLAGVGFVSAEAPDVVLETIITGLSGPLTMTHAGDDSGRLFVAQQTGRIMIWDGAALLGTPFLDLSSVVSCCGERGLLGLAFHPGFPSNGHFFVFYTDGAGDTVVARYTVSGDDPDVADPDSAEIVLTQPQPQSNHNGGQIAFGPDGYLYVGLGDGGGAGDPLGSGQDPATWLGKILRLDADTLPYAVPADNPLVGVVGAREEIWALGLRNPWRFSFDTASGDLFIADVGQNAWEELDLQPSSSAGGENYGWRLMEGGHCFDPPTGCNDGSLSLPILEYAHADGRCSIIGGFRYRGLLYPNLRGTYVFGDYCTGEVLGATVDGAGEWSFEVLAAIGHAYALVSFGEDEDGELYVGDLSGGGRVHRVLDLSPVDLIFADGFDSADTSAWSSTTP